MRIRCLVACLCLAVAAGCPGVSGNTAPPKMLDLIASLDAPEYAESVPWPEHIALVYRLAQGRPPSETEYHTLVTWAHEGTIRRSDALSFALANGAQTPTIARCAAFARRVGVEDLVPSPADRAVAADLAARDPEVFAKAMRDEQTKRMRNVSPAAENAVAPPQKAGEAYNVYFGNLHSHSALSDGRGTPDEAYHHARHEGGLDFFALTDHGELLILWPWDNKWQRLLDAADAADDPGAFAAMYGFEWSNPVLGHINVLQSRRFTHALENFWLGTMYNWVASRPGAVAHFNHPNDGSTTLGIDFLFLMPWPRAREAFAGIEIINGNSGLGKYFYDTAWYSDLTYLDVGNQNGWHLGPFASQDNHRQNWGTKNQARTAVLATELTRDAITRALRARRFYTTEDQNLRLDVRCQGFPMGTELTGGERIFTVTASDDDGDRFERLRLVRNGKVIEDRPLFGVQVVAESLTDTATGPAWYYVILTQTDDNDGDGRNDEAVSSPIRFPE